MNNADFGVFYAVMQPAYSQCVCVVLFIFEAILARHQTSDFLRRLFIYSYWSLTCSYVCSTLVEGGMYIGGIWPAYTRRMGKMFLWLLFVLNALNWIPLAMLYLYCMCKKEFWMRARNVWGFLVSAPSTRFLVRGKICVLHRHHHRIIWILLHTILTGMRKKLMLTSHGIGPLLRGPRNYSPEGPNI